MERFEKVALKHGITGGFGNKGYDIDAIRDKETGVTLFQSIPVSRGYRSGLRVLPTANEMFHFSDGTHDSSAANQSLDLFYEAFDNHDSEDVDKKAAANKIAVDLFAKYLQAAQRRAAKKVKK